MCRLWRSWRSSVRRSAFDSEQAIPIALRECNAALGMKGSGPLMKQLDLLSASLGLQFGLQTAVSSPASSQATAAHHVAAELSVPIPIAGGAVDDVLTESGPVGASDIVPLVPETDGASASLCPLQSSDSVARIARTGVAMVADCPWRREGADSVISPANSPGIASPAPDPTGRGSSPTSAESDHLGPIKPASTAAPFASRLREAYRAVQAAAAAAAAANELVACKARAVEFATRYAAATQESALRAQMEVELLNALPPEAPIPPHLHVREGVGVDACASEEDDNEDKLRFAGPSGALGNARDGTKAAGAVADVEAGVGVTSTNRATGLDGAALAATLDERSVGQRFDAPGPIYAQERMSDSLADLASVAGEIAAQRVGTVTLRISSELAEEVWAQAATEVAATAAYEAEAAAAAAAAAEVAATDTPGNAEASVGKGGEKRVSISADVMSGCEVAGASGVAVAADAGHLSEATATEAEPSALSGLSPVFRFSDESETGIDIADVMGGKEGDHGARGDVEASSVADVAEVPQVEALVGAVQAGCDLGCRRGGGGSKAAAGGGCRRGVGAGTWNGRGRGVWGNNWGG